MYKKQKQRGKTSIQKETNKNITVKMEIYPISVARKVYEMSI